MTYQPGEILSINWHAGIQHDGIYTDAGTVIAASKRNGRVQEEDLNTFAAGREIISKGYPSDLPSETVIGHARTQLGKKYNLLGYNCQHFASECHGKKQSRQLRSVLWAAAGIGISIALRRSRIFRT